MLSFPPLINALKIIIPGTKPKDTISAKESSCLPNSDWTFSNLATNPSKKSATAATKIKIMPKRNASLKKDNTAKQPQKRFKAVIEFGIIDFNIWDFQQIYISFRQPSSGDNRPTI